ncbi:MAG: putative RNA polymerase omega subunit [Candidatus Scalindua rubra]|uniref:DNA-directed RNA polymerase subunit omega n=1 Tax=Candidatus Scalindua rubra TaxID=1872076 RepID=A0A1E3X7V1_9BACT|nr:MAG: putative RNA polymerase omega subunit [Candidatus Scalindua rubra]
MPNISNKSTKNIGTFHLTTLLIKRSRELIDGAPKLIETDLNDPFKIAFKEYVSGKLKFADDELKK